MASVLSHRLFPTLPFPGRGEGAAMDEVLLGTRAAMGSALTKPTYDNLYDDPETARTCWKWIKMHLEAKGDKRDIVAVEAAMKEREVLRPCPRLRSRPLRRAPVNRPRRMTSVDLKAKRDAILAAYKAQKVTINGVQVSLASATFIVESGYRNPQRNRAVGSEFPNSFHVRGRALDLVPQPVMVKINGSRTPIALNRHKHLCPALLAAAKTAGTAISENGSEPVPVGDPREDHIHVQW